MQRSRSEGTCARGAGCAGGHGQLPRTGQLPRHGARDARCLPRRRASVWRCLLATLPVLIALCGFAPSPASATKAHIFDFAFGSAQLQSPAGIAISEASSNIYVADQGHARIQEFSESGTPLASFTGAAAPTGPLENPKDVAIDNSQNPLDPSENDIYVSGEVKVAGEPVHVIYKFSESGTYLGQITSGPGATPFGELLGVAVDTTGQLWVYQPSALGNGEVIHYSNALENELAGSCEDERGPSPGLAVDSEGNAYVNTGNREFAKLNGSCEQLIFSLGKGEGNEPGPAAAVDTQSNEVYVDELTNVAHFTPTAELLERFAHEEEPSEGNLTEGAGIAVNSASAEKLLYVADRGSNSVKAYHEVTRPTVATLPASGLGPEKATLNATVNPEGIEVSSCVFQYGESTTYGKTIACEQQPGSGEAPVAVSAKPAGLQPGKTYHYRILATNENGSSRGEDQSFSLGPGIEAEGVGEVSADAATFSATINPHRTATTAFFQYGTSTEYGTNVPATPISLGEGEGGVQLAPQHIQGLAENTTYHFRVVAIQEGREFLGEDRTFTTQGQGGSLSLPDHRAWQLVSPPEKHGGVIEGIGQAGAAQAAGSGEAVSYLANAPTEASPQGGTGFVQVLSRNSTAGWSSKDIASPHARATGQGLAPPEYTLFDEQLSAGVIQPWGLFDARLSEEASEQTPYLRALGGCESDCYHPLVTAKPGHANALPGFGEGRECEEENGLILNVTVQCGPFFTGATADLKHIALISAAPLSDGAGREQLYEWTGGAIAQVSILPRNGAGEELPAPEGSARLGAGFGQEKGRPKAQANATAAKRAISANGSRVFWEAEGTLYVRDTTLGQTLQLDKAEKACEEAAECESGGGRFQIAAANGSSVLFTDARRLMKASATGGDLYECKIILEGSGRLGCELSDLTPEHGGERALVQGSVLGASEDDQTLYFVAEGALASNHNARGEAAAAGQANLYVRRGGTIGFIAKLATGDRQNWTSHDEEQPVRVSSDGSWLAFASERPLTGYDNRDAASGKPDAEIYEYEAGSGKLSCASCNPSGARPHGVEFATLGRTSAEPLIGRQPTWEASGWVAALLPPSPSFAPEESAYQTRALSDSGRVFFNALDPLVPQDVNGNWDVYEREPAGVGGCGTGAQGFEGSSGSCLGLISSGASAQQSAFLDASKSGGDVFFLTSAQLTGKDIDSARDVYDAHECTSAAPCPPEESVQPPPCSTEASCRPAPSPQPQIFGAPASSSFSGPGNQPPPPPPPVVKAKKPTRHELLVKALASCHKRFAKSKARRVSCERSARRKYGPVPAKKAVKKAGGKSAKGKKSSRGGRR